MWLDRLARISHQLRDAWFGEKCADLGCEESACFLCEQSVLGYFTAARGV